MRREDKMERVEVREETSEGTSRAALARHREKLREKKKSSKEITVGVVGVKDRGSGDGRGEEMEDRGRRRRRNFNEKRKFLHDCDSGGTEYSVFSRAEARLTTKHNLQ